MKNPVYGGILRYAQDDSWVRFNPRLFLEREGIPHALAMEELRLSDNGHVITSSVGLLCVCGPFGADDELAAITRCLGGDDGPESVVLFIIPAGLMVATELVGRLVRFCLQWLIGLSRRFKATIAAAEQGCYGIEDYFR